MRPFVVEAGSMGSDDMRTPVSGKRTANEGSSTDLTVAHAAAEVAGDSHKAPDAFDIRFPTNELPNTQMASEGANRITARTSNKEIDALVHARVSAAQEAGICYCTSDATERKRLERRTARGTLTRPMRGMYVETLWWKQLDMIQRHRCLAKTLARLHPSWAFCGVTAAVIWGFSVPYYALKRIHVARHKGDHYQNTDAVRFHELSTCEFVHVAGIRVTNAERTAIDCMRTLPFAYGLAVADSATRICSWSNLHLIGYLSTTPLGRPHGLCRARLVAFLADGQSESGGESIARANMIHEGFALPDLQVEVPKPTGGCPYRVDFAWGQATAGAPIYGECDGRIKYTDSVMLGDGDALDALLRERRRESCLTLSSSSIVRFSPEEASSRTVLSRLLDTFGVPRACEPLVFTRDARHNMREIRRYLQANSAHCASARLRLDFLEDNDKRQGRPSGDASADGIRRPWEQSS